MPLTHWDQATYAVRLSSSSIPGNGLAITEQS